MVLGGHLEHSDSTPETLTTEQRRLLTEIFYLCSEWCGMRARGEYKKADELKIKAKDEYSVEFFSKKERDGNISHLFRVSSPYTCKMGRPWSERLPIQGSLGFAEIKVGETIKQGEVNE